MVMPILDRLRQHQQDEAAGRFGGTDPEQLPVLGGTPDPIRRGPLAALSALGLLMEGINNTAAAGTGGGLALNAKLNPFMRMGLNDNAGLFSGTRLANEAATGFGQGRGNLVQRMMAANEEAARGDERTIGALNIMTDPTTYFGVGGGALASGGGRLAKLGKMMQFLDEVQGLGVNHLGGTALKKLGIATDQGLRPEVTSFLRDRASGAGLGAATGAANASIYGNDLEEAMTGRESEGNAILKGALAGGLAGGAVGRRNIGRNLSDVLGGRLGGEGGLIARRALLNGATDQGDEAVQMAMGMSPGQIAAMRRRKGAVQPAAVPELADLVGEEQAQELITMFSGGKAPLSKEMISRAIVNGRNNTAADGFAALINKHWDRAKAGQFSAHDIISSYIPAILSQRRGAISPETALFNQNRLEQLGTKYPDLVAKVRGNLTEGGTDAGLHRPEDLAAYMMLHTDEGRDLGTALRYGDPEGIQTAIDNFSAIWPDAGFFPGSSAVPGTPVIDPEKLVPYEHDFIGPTLDPFDRSKPSKKNPLGALKQLTGSDIRGGERGALVQAAQDDVFSSMAEFINRAVMRGNMSGDQIAQVMRDWTEGGGSTDVAFRDLTDRAGMPAGPLEGPADYRYGNAWDNKVGPGGTSLRGQVKGNVDPRLASKNNWGAIIDRIAEGKSGFLTTNLGGPSATFDVRVGDAMAPGSTLADYQRALDIMFPGDDPGLGHHKFWDAMSYDPMTDTAGQSKHGAIAELMGAVGEGYHYPNPLNAGINPGDIEGGVRSLLDRLKQTLPPAEEVDANLGRFMDGAHKLLKNEDGTPRVLYHGTRGTFDQFTPSESGSFGPAVYLATNPKQANLFAGTQEGAQVYPVYANALKIYTSKNGIMTPAQVARVRAQGYDAIYHPGNLAADPADDGWTGQFAIFDPAKIKSATGNSGAYDPSNPSMMHAGIDPSSIADLATRFKDRFAKPVNMANVKSFDVPGPLKGETKVYTPAENELIDQIMDIKLQRVDADKAASEALAREHYIETTGTDQGFDEMWHTLVQGNRTSQVLEVGFGSKLPVMKNIVKSGLGSRPGFDPALGGYNDLIDRKMGRVRKAMDRGQVENFVGNEAAAHENLGAGNPLLRDDQGNVTGLNPEAVPPMYGSFTPGNPGGMEMGGTIRAFYDLKKNPRHLQTIHHHYMSGVPEVEDFHRERTAKAVQALWGPENAKIREMFGRGDKVPVGNTGNTMLDTPIIVHPLAAPEANAAMSIMGTSADNLKRAPEQPRDAAFDILRGAELRGNKTGTERKAAMLGGQRNVMRSEALIFDYQPEFIQAMAYSGGTSSKEGEALALIKKYMEQFGIADRPVYRLAGPVGRLPDMLPPDIAPGRANIVDQYTKAKDWETGGNYTDLGAGISPGAIGDMVKSAGRPALVGGALGGAAGFASDEDDRTRGFMKGALGGAIAGTVGSKLLPEVGRAVATSYRNHAPDLLDDTVLDPAALAIANENGVKAQAAADQLPGATLKDLPRQIDDAWRAQVVNTFRGLGIDAASLWLLVKDFGRDYGVDRATVKNVQGQLIANYHDPDPLVRIGHLGDVMEGWGIEGFLSDGNLNQTLGTSFSQAEIGENALSGPQRALTGAALSFTNLRDAMIPVAGPVIGAVRQYYAPYIDAAYRTLNNFQHAAPRIAFWDAALRRELPVAANEWLRTASAAKGFDFTRLQAKLTSGGMVRPSEVGQFLQNNYKGLTTAEVNAFQANYQEALDVVAMKSADRIAHIFGDFRDKSAQPWKTFIGRVFPFSRYAMQFAPVGLEMAKRHPLIVGAGAAGLGASIYATTQNEEAPWNAGSIPISTETPGLGALARLRLGGQSGTMRVDPLSNFTGPISGETFSMGGGLPTDTTYDKAKGLLGRAGFSPHPILDSLASVTGQTNRNPSPASRTAPLEQALELIPGMPTIPSIQGAFNTTKGTITGRTPDDFDPVARHYAEMVLDLTGKPLEDKSNRQRLINVGDVDDPLWRQARQEVRLMGLVGGLASNLTPLTQSAQGRGAEIVNEGYRDRITDEELLRLAQTDPVAARKALADRDDDPRLRTYRLANTVDRNRELTQLSGPRLTPALTQMLKLQREEEFKRKDR